MINYIAIVILILTIYLVNKNFELKNILNPYVFFFLFHIFFLYISIFYASNYEHANIYISNNTKVYIIYSLIASFLGAYLAKFFWLSQGSTYKKILHLKIVDNSKKQHALYYSTLLIFVLGVLMSLYYTYKIGGFIWFQGNFEDIRINSRKGSGFITILSIVFVTYSTLLLLLMKRNKLLFKIFIFFIAAIALLSFGNRAPFLKLLLLWLILSLIIKNPNFKLSSFLFYGFFSFMVMVLLGTIRKGVDEILEVFLVRIPWRPFVNTYTFELVQNNFPEKVNFLYGYGYIIDILTILPGYQPNLGTWVKEQLNMSFEGGSVTFSYLGDAYINFGYIGVLFIPIIFGFFLNSIYLVLLKRRTVTLQRLIYISLISMGFAGSVNVGFMGPFIYNIIPIVLIVFMHKVFISIIKIKKKG